MTRVFICSSYRALSDDPLLRAQERRRNLRVAKMACYVASKLGYEPVAPHLQLTRFLRDEDPEERRVGIEMGFRWMEACDFLWVIGPRISEGMSREIAHATEIGIPIRCIPLCCLSGVCVPTFASDVCLL